MSKLPPIPNPENPAPPLTMSLMQNSILDSDEVSFILKNTLTPTNMEDPLVLKYLLAYVQCRDNREASEIAGISNAQGRKIRNWRDVDLAIQKLTEKQVMKYGYDTEELVAKIKDIVYVDVAELQNEDGSYKVSLAELSPGFRRAIKKFKVKNLYDFDPNGMKVKIGELVEVELYDKVKSVELLDRAKDRVFKETKTVEHEIGGNMGRFLLESEERANKAASDAREVGIIEIEGKTIDV